MNAVDLKTRIEQRVKAFQSGSLEENAVALFDTLGYRSDKTLSLVPNTAQTFTDAFARDRAFDQVKARTLEWRSIDLLFQLTADEIRMGREQGSLLFETGQTVDNARIESYLFFAIDLEGEEYTRTQLAEITRAVNRLFLMPVMLLFRHGQTLSFAVIDRRISRRDEAQDVLLKVTLIKDIRVRDPLRAECVKVSETKLSTFFV
jgi:adenine-specific DNA-methyltransferase